MVTPAQDTQASHGQRVAAMLRNEDLREPQPNA